MERKPYYPHLPKGFEKLEQPLAELIEFERIADVKISELEKDGRESPPAPRLNPPGMNGQGPPDNCEQQIAALKQQKADLNKKFEGKVASASIGLEEKRIEKLQSVIKYHRSPNQFKMATKDEVKEFTSQEKSLDRGFDFIAKKHFSGYEGDPHLIEQRREISLDDMSDRFVRTLNPPAQPSDMDLFAENKEMMEPDKE